ncbi:MAG TPA: 4Fe-4S dicluster domain-containing protein [Spirochaetia bacterium]|nr:4Fe-4S dicluster domain-containing protein [Spirochaetia bacterium]
MKNYRLMILSFVLFYGIAVAFWLLFHQIFYLYNFAIIGTSIGVSLGLWPLLPRKRKHIARKLCQGLVGGYMFLGLGAGLVYLGFGVIRPENMQIEGFWFLLLGGVFAASVMHYAIAKIAGPFLFNRTWCGWACWTAGILDLLPWQKSPGRLDRRFGLIRYAAFVVGAALVFFLVFARGYTAQTAAGLVDLTGKVRFGTVYRNLFLIPEFWWFAGGNALYYGIGIALAAILKDNRAFCKYVCPVAAFLKVGSRVALLRIGANGECSLCEACEAACPMDVKITDYVSAGKRVASTECILCMTCVNSCSKGILSPSFSFDLAWKEHLRLRGQP